MAFWGVLLKPNEPYTLQSSSKMGPSRRLRISQATLSDRSGLWTSRSVVRCAVGSKPPVSICSLSTRESTSCQLDLEFEETDDVVFSVKGPRGVHLAGYFHNSSIVTTSMDASPTRRLEGKENIVTKDSDFNTTRDMKITDIDDIQLQNIPPATKELQEGALQTEYIANEKSGSGSLLGRAMSDDDDANEEQINEKTNQSSQENRSVFHKCDSEVLNAQKLKDSISSEKVLVSDIGVLKENEHQAAMVSNATELLLQENGYVSPSWKSEECHPLPAAASAATVIGCRKVKKKKGRKETVADQFKFMEDNAAAHQAITDNIFEIDSCLRSLHNNAANGNTSSRDTHIHSKKVKKNKKKNKDMEDDTHLDKYIISGKDPFQQQDQHTVKEGEKEIAKEKEAINGSSKKEEKSDKTPSDSKRRRREQQQQQHDDGNPKGGDQLVSSELTVVHYMEDGGGGGANDRRNINNNKYREEVVEKNNKLLDDGGGTNQRQNIISDDNIEVVAAGCSSSASQRKKLKKVRFAEEAAPLGKQKQDQRHDDLPEEKRGDFGGGVYVTEESVEIGGGAINRRVDDRKQMMQKNDDKLADVAEEASGYLSSVSHRKKKKKVTMGEGTFGNKDLNSQHHHHALVSQSKLPNGRLHDDDDGHERSDISAVKVKKKRKQDLDDGDGDNDDKHVVVKKRKISEVAREEDTEGSSSKDESKSSLKVKSIKGDVHVQAGNAKGRISDKKGKAKSKRKKECSSSNNNMQ